MNITFSNDFTDRHIPLRLGVIKADVTIEPSAPQLVQLMDDATKKRIQEFSGQAASSAPHIDATRKAYKALGKDPARYRPAAEALTRRILQGKALYEVNNVVDINNLISIQSGISIGTYLADKVDGDILFRRAEKGESYVGIGRAELNLEGLPVFCDDQGPFGCPTSDSERTMIAPGNHKITMILIDFLCDPALPAWLERAETLLKDHAMANNLNSRIIQGS